MHLLKSARRIFENRESDGEAEAAGLEIHKCLMNNDDRKVLLPY